MILRDRAQCEGPKLSRTQAVERSWLRVERPIFRARFVRIENEGLFVHSPWVRYPEVYPPPAAPKATGAGFGLVGRTC